MRKSRLCRVAVGGALLASAVAGVGWGPSPVEAQQPPPEVLVFTRTAGFRHDSIPNGVAAIEALGERFGFEVDNTEDPGAFTDANLAQYDAVVFLHTTGNVLPTAANREALERFIEDGNGFLGIHAASDMGATVRDGWPWYRDLVGAAFKAHTVARMWSDTPFASIPDFLLYMGPFADAPSDAQIVGPGIAATSWEPAEVVVEDPASPLMRGWGRSVVRSDEWYGFLTNPRDNEDIHVVASLDESSYDPANGVMGGDHPIVWCQQYDGGRSVYTAMGHTKASWSEARFLRQILGGVQMAAGLPNAPFDC